LLQANTKILVAEKYVEKEVRQRVMMSIKEWWKIITDYAVAHGFNWTPEDVDTMLLRIRSEVSEASEAGRDENKQELAEEMADIFIRLADACEVMGIDLEAEVTKKHGSGLQRENLHGRKRK
jgi:NTP pyrophosphatase (non-canonical NTP hydrolase)